MSVLELFKAAAAPLQGRLYLSQSGFLLLSVPNAIGHGFFKALNEPGLELPLGSEGKFNCHVTVMRASEVEKIGAHKITERGHAFEYTLGKVADFNPVGWPEMNRCWVVKVHSQALERLRKTYGLPALPEHEDTGKKLEFHATFAVRRSGVLGSNSTAKVHDEGRKPIKITDRVGVQLKKAADSVQHTIISGHSGAGKSTLGRQMAAETGMPLLRADKDPEMRAWFDKMRTGEDEKSPNIFISRVNPEAQKVVMAVVERMLKAQAPSIMEGTQFAHVPQGMLAGHKKILVDKTPHQIVRQRLGRDRGKVKNGPIPPGSAKARARSSLTRRLIDDLAPGIERFREGAEVRVPNMKTAADAVAAPRHTLITGMPGAGKTTLGKQLGTELGKPVVHLDEEGDRTPSGRPPDTDSARKLLAALLEPSIVEGAQLLGLSPEERVGHDVRHITQPREEIVRRLMQRGWQNTVGKVHIGPESESDASALYDTFKGIEEKYGWGPQITPQGVKTAADGIFRPSTAEEYAQAGNAFGKTFPTDRDLYIATDPDALGGMGGFAEVFKGGPADAYSRDVYTGLSKPLDAYLNGFFVREGQRGKGLGGKLLARLRGEYQRLGAATDNSGEDTDASALHLYKKHGFQPVKEEDASTYWYLDQTPAANVTGQLQPLSELMGSRGRARQYGRPEPEGVDRDWISFTDDPEEQQTRMALLKQLEQYGYKMKDRPGGFLTATSKDADYSVYPSSKRAQIHHAWKLIESGMTKDEAWAQIEKKAEDFKDPSYSPEHPEECCPHCGARLERGDAGDCNRCGKPWPKEAAATVTLGQAVASAARKAVKPKSEAQADAGNYRKGHVHMHGLNISIETKKGQKRNPAWPALQNHYGYIRRTEGADGDHVDVFIGDTPTTELVFVVDQVDPKTQKFDEHKCMCGFESRKAARDAYLSNYEPGWKGLGKITPLTMPQFKEWLKDGSQKRPVSTQMFQMKKAAGAPETILVLRREGVLQLISP